MNMFTGTDEDRTTFWVMIICVLMCLLVVHIFSSDNLRMFPKRTQETESVRELREIIKECRSMDRGYPSIETLFNAPVGQPRKPIKWVVTCKRMK